MSAQPSSPAKRLSPAAGFSRVMSILRAFIEGDGCCVEIDLSKPSKTTSDEYSYARTAVPHRFVSSALETSVLHFLGFSTSLTADHHLDHCLCIHHHHRRVHYRPTTLLKIGHPQFKMGFLLLPFYGLGLIKVDDVVNCSFIGPSI
ncbi:hypothetical protein L2E82_37887 [Cichorium intybus]|uniref:Uncharacterized protein n=1 Tax=Cichorium intybus TaxID=13427 RepID=A0ACB9AGV8_CICIN|nr:hypothetical protein L2E82_37887 [Cichorium intybus]